MKKYLLYMFVIATFCSCEKKASIVGDWVEVEVGDKIESLDYLKFNADGTFTETSLMSVMAIESYGTYEVMGDSLIRKIQDTKLNGHSGGPSVSRWKILKLTDDVFEYQRDDFTKRMIKAKEHGGK